MGTRAGTLSLCVAIAAVTACGHLDKVKVTEIPIDQFQATPVGSTAAASPTLTPIIDETPPAATTTSASTPSSPSKPAASAAASAAPAQIEAPDPAQDKIDAAKKLMATGKHADLLAAKKILAADVGSGNGTQGEAKLLKVVCTKLGDKGCAAKAASYIK